MNNDKKVGSGNSNSNSNSGGGEVVKSTTKVGNGAAGVVGDDEDILLTETLENIFKTEQDLCYEIKWLCSDITDTLKEALKTGSAHNFVTTLKQQEQKMTATLAQLEHYDDQKKSLCDQAKIDSIHKKWIAKRPAVQRRRSVASGTKRKRDEDSAISGGGGSGTTATAGLVNVQEVLNTYASATKKEKSHKSEKSGKSESKSSRKKGKKKIDCGDNNNNNDDDDNNNNNSGDNDDDGDDDNDSDNNNNNNSSSSVATSL